MADIKVQVTHDGPGITITARVSGPDWALGLDPDEARELYAKALARSLSDSWQRMVNDMAREMIEGTGKVEPRGLFHSSEHHVSDRRPKNRRR